MSDGASDPAAPVLRLPRGRHGLSPDHVRRSQVGRLQRACVDQVGRLGFRTATVEHVVRAAGVSRQTFYETYVTKADCLREALAVWEAGLADAVRAAMRDAADADAAMEAAVDVTLGRLEADPLGARCLLVERQHAGLFDAPEEALRRNAAAAALAAAIGARDVAAVGYAVAALEGVLRTELVIGRGERLGRLREPMLRIARSVLTPR